ncbi:L-lactate MFS transporter [Bacillus tuaregi]|uniref:L-lactate MFS transporter n=1 Tax=Bacillus tuaregi TaxID=1816695 RepID=UPI0008F8D32A|nr:OFA family MFS transporter [Bacillus tuaregi]
MRDSKNRWLIVLGTIIVMMALGTIYTWSLYNQSLVDRFGWELSSVSTTFSIMSLSLAVATLFSSKLQEKIGLRRLILFSGFAMGLGLIISSQMSSLWGLYLFAGIVVGGADGLAYMTTLSNALKWFPERKGLISGISVGSYGMGSLFFKYINGAILEAVGITQTFLFWGIIVIVMMAVGSFFIREATVKAGASAAQLPVARNYSVKEMLRTKEAYLLFIVLFTTCMSGLFVIGIVADIGVSMVGLSAASAANAVAIVAIFNTLGRIVLGSLSDKLGRMTVVSGSIIAMTLAVAALSYLDLNYGFYIASVAIIAFSFGGNITIFPAIVADFFGLKNSGQNYGIIYQGFGLGALSASFISILLGGFASTFKLIMVLSIMSVIIALTLKAPRAKQEKGKVVLKKLQHKAS